MAAAPRTSPGLAITEKAFMAQVVDLARTLGWATYHPFLSIHSPRGWPDLALCRPPRLILAELKSEKGKTSPAQEEWLRLLKGCPGVEVFLWRPSELDEIARILQQLTGAAGRPDDGFGHYETCDSACPCYTAGIAAALLDAPSPESVLRARGNHDDATEGKSGVEWSPTL